MIKLNFKHSVVIDFLNILYLLLLRNTFHGNCLIYSVFKLEAFPGKS